MIGTESWEIQRACERYVLSGIAPVFSDDGEHFLAAVGEDRLMASDCASGDDWYDVEDMDGFAHCALFLPGGTKVAAGVRSGFVRVYDLEGGIAEKEFRLLDGDAAKSIDASPDGEFIVIGTARGYIYRWSLNGLVYSEDEKIYIDPTPEGRRKRKIERNTLKDAMTMTVGYHNLPSGDYVGSMSLDVGYRYNFKYPLYFTANADIGVGVPNANSTYSYTIGGESYSSPFQYSFATTLGAGLVYYNKRFDISLFSEMGMGAALRVFWNNSFTEYVVGRPYGSFIADVCAGAQWKWIRAYGGILFDSNLQFMYKVNVGVAVPLELIKIKKPAANKGF